MVDSARQLLDELMGRNRNIDPTAGPVKELHWQDEENCLFYLVQFCPHELFINTRADLGPCRKVHDESIKKLYEEADDCGPKKRYEDEFLRFCLNMINDVDRKIQKGKQRLMQQRGDSPPQPSKSKAGQQLQEQLNKMNERINKLVAEAEEAGTRGDVDQAMDLMLLCDNLKVERENLIKDNPQEWTSDSVQSHNNHDKLMEVCEICGAFLIVGDAQQRLEDHLLGKQHLGYAKLRKAVEELYKRRKRVGDLDRGNTDKQRRGAESDRRHREGRQDRWRDHAGSASSSHRSRGGDRHDRGSHRPRNRSDRGDSRRRSRS